MSFLGYTVDDDSGLTVSQAAEYTGLTPKAIKSRCDRGTLSYYKNEKETRLIPVEELERITQKSLLDLPFNPYDYDPKFDIPKAELWGNGKAPVIKPATHEQWETVVFLSDMHVPYHDPVLIDGTIEIIKAINPHRVVINGDTNDFFSLSRFNRALERLDILQQELDQGKMIRKALREAAPNAHFDETIGNHEERLITYPAFNAPALRSLESLKPSTLLGLGEFDITHWPQNGFRLREDFLVEHGSAVRKQSGATAKARLEDSLISGIMGHTHRLDSYRRSGYRDLSWFEQGCLCMLNPDYVNNEANWRQGFAIGTFSTKTDNFNVQLVQAIGRGFIFDGKHYGDTSVEADIWAGPVPNMETEFIHRDPNQVEVLTT